MKRQIVFLGMFIGLIGLTGWITSLGKVGVFPTFTYSQLFSLTLAHLRMVFIAELIAMGVGIPLGVLASRPGLNRLAPIVVGGANIGQSIPSLAVIAIMAPLLGFGLQSAIVALFIYGLLPVVRNSYAGLGNIQPALIEASRGMGMTRWQILRSTELPLAVPVIVAGIRISTIITVGTAELAVLVGGTGLGVITLSGVFNRQPLLILQGAAPTALLAITLGFILEQIENWITPRGLKIRT